MAPTAMLSVAGLQWPATDCWRLEPKWDGFRLLVEVGGTRGSRAWSRHATDFTARLGDLLTEFDDLPAGTLLDGELIALGERDGRAVADFARVCRAVLMGDDAAARHLRFVAFDLLADGVTDLRGRPYLERTARLAERLPGAGGGRVHRVQAHAPLPETHAALVELGFEGCVLKHVDSTYRSGRSRQWRKHKARHEARGTVLGVWTGRDRRRWASIKTGGRRVTAAAGLTTLIGESVLVTYSRVDAGGDLREARVTWAAGRPPRGRRPTRTVVAR